MSDLEKLKRHLGRLIPITIKNKDGIEDTFNLKPLNVEQQAILMEVSNVVQSREEIEINGVKVPDVKKEELKEMELLLIDVMKNSLNDVDDETIIDFVNTNFEQLSVKLSELVPTQKNSKDLEIAKKKIEALKNEQSK